jgi:AraC-like DNA-binding protein
MTTLSIWHNTGNIIYGLEDPRYNLIRYVGKTECCMGQRFSGHLTEAKCGKLYKKTKWINELFNLNMKPKIILLAYNIPKEKLNEEENYFMDITKEECFAFGIECVNVAKGGGGGKCKHFTKEEEEEICKEYSEHPHIHNLRAKYHSPYGRIVQILRKHGVMIKSDYRKHITPDVISMYKQGFFMDDICKKFNVSIRVIDRILKKDRISRNRLMPQNDQLALIAAYKNGIKIKDICKEFGTSIYYVLRKFGISERRLKKFI